MVDSVLKYRRLDPIPSLGNIWNSFLQGVQQRNANQRLKMEQQKQQAALAPFMQARSLETLRQQEIGLDSLLKGMTPPPETPFQEDKPGETGELQSIRRAADTLAKRTARETDRPLRQEQYERNYAALRQQMADGVRDGFIDPELGLLPDQPMDEAALRDRLSQVRAARRRMTPPQPR